jgi:hypothetical protein
LNPIVKKISKELIRVYGTYASQFEDIEDEDKLADNLERALEYYEKCLEVLSVFSFLSLILSFFNSVFFKYFCVSRARGLMIRKKKLIAIIEWELCFRKLLI